MLGSTVLFSLMHVCVRFLSAELHPFEIAFFRNFLALIFLLPFMLKDGAALLQTAHPVALAAGCLERICHADVLLRTVYYAAGRSTGFELYRAVVCYCDGGVYSA